MLELRSISLRAGSWSCLRELSELSIPILCLSTRKSIWTKPVIIWTDSRRIVASSNLYTSCAALLTCWRWGTPRQNGVKWLDKLRISKFNSSGTIQPNWKFDLPAMAEIKCPASTLLRCSIFLFTLSSLLIIHFIAFKRVHDFHTCRGRTRVLPLIDMGPWGSLSCL